MEEQWTLHLRRLRCSGPEKWWTLFPIFDMRIKKTEWHRPSFSTFSTGRTKNSATYSLACDPLYPTFPSPVSCGLLRSGYSDRSHLEDRSEDRNQPSTPFARAQFTLALDLHEKVLQKQNNQNVFRWSSGIVQHAIISDKVLRNQSSTEITSCDFC